MMHKKEIGIGLLGLGVIGGQVARVLQERADELAVQAGVPLVLRKIKVLPVDLCRPQAQQMDQSLFTVDDDEFFDTPGLDIIIELIGGEQPALKYLRRALEAGKQVVTANKEVIAKHGIELMQMASERNLNLRFEAAVGGGMPLIAPLQRDLIVNHINGLYAIINGTTNYILSRMSHDNLDFATALSQAQQLGYAESNPKNDIEGYDATYKLAILATLAFQSPVKPDEIQPEGISKLSERDFQYARELGFTIKLMAIAKQSGGEIEVRVHPVFVPEDSFLANVDGVYNAVLVDGDLTGKVTFLGKGAGPLPTSSAVVADVIAIAHAIQHGNPGFTWHPRGVKRVKPLAEVITRYYIRMTVADRPGVLSQIASVLGDHDISIASVIQKESYADTQTAEIVIMTHPARENSMQQAFTEFRGLANVQEINNFVRVEDIA
jgi:homoserine dehydrogenase